MINESEGLITIDEDVTNEAYGYQPYNRPIEQLLNYGFIPLDKPAGPTSHEVVAWVRRILDVKKAGHSGTLDPPVTGVLPIGIGEATKVLGVLLMGPKEYYAVARLHSPVDQAKLNRVFSEFVGEIYQRPPQRSSVKRTIRTRTIYNLEILEQMGRLLLLRVVCQAGTYVRKLVYDIGEVLGPGATMVELRRTRVSHIDEKDGLVRLHDLLDAYQIWREKGDEEKLRRLIKPVEYAVLNLKKVFIRDSAVDAICHGAQLAVPGIVKISKDISKGDLVAIYTLKGELVALGEAIMSTTEVLNADKGIAFSTKRVIMKAGTYPRMWK
ncbi:MAG: RNA-guided pseudouridylation complex pseudouridine synthase subunit Cbf5 [Nitrososphaerota archaeon]|nr:RNA-guided pseudouridylation complex pseudouridine synthase subunit Cbf5 [Nitrososphaerales archaeon]MDW8044277.1 RNA-guided pseudouridylation complex pseudouridine synthase subunit Cbf5 [Nitrososphaerota archaeon]